MKVENLLADPDITFHAESTIDLNALKHAFSITKKSISMERGKWKPILGSTLPYVLYKRSGDWGTITAEGKLKTDKIHAT
mgnify:CR=1 FL=1